MTLYTNLRYIGRPGTELPAVASWLQPVAEALSTIYRRRYLVPSFSGSAPPFLCAIAASVGRSASQTSLVLGYPASTGVPSRLSPVCLSRPRHERKMRRWVPDPELVKGLQRQPGLLVDCVSPRIGNWPWANITTRTPQNTLHFPTFVFQSPLPKIFSFPSPPSSLSFAYTTPSDVTPACFFQTYRHGGSLLQKSPKVLSCKGKKQEPSCTSNSATSYRTTVSGRRNERPPFDLILTRCPLV